MTAQQIQAEQMEWVVLTCLLIAIVIAAVFVVRTILEINSARDGGHDLEIEGEEVE